MDIDIHILYMVYEYININTEAFDIDGNDITNLYITNEDINKRCFVWTTTDAIRNI